jgi:hypothetical protein
MTEFSYFSRRSGLLVSVEFWICEGNMKIKVEPFATCAFNNPKQPAMNSPEIPWVGDKPSFNRLDTGELQRRVSVIANPKPIKGPSLIATDAVFI